MGSLIIYPVSSVKEPQQKEALLQDLNTKESWKASRGHVLLQYICGLLIFKNKSRNLSMAHTRINHYITYNVIFGQNGYWFPTSLNLYGLGNNCRIKTS